MFPKLSGMSTAYERGISWNCDWWWTMQVKVINGSAHIFNVEEAARRLGGLGMRVGQLPEALSIPYEVEFPFAVRAGNRDYEVEVRGSYNAILALQRMVN